ncbi:m-phase inducer phosphatase [Marasmius tenuissimus]|nr:m-phase inducer phosphatase [Marasmius tenuissimus]
MPSTNFLAAPLFFRKRSNSHVQQQPQQQRDDVDEFLSSDLELSFASSVSINSPSRENIALTPDTEYAEPMDISPLPPSKTTQSVAQQQPLAQKRPRAFTTAARLFSDVSNQPPTTLQPSPSIIGSTKSSSKRTQRAALPNQWFVPPANPDSSGNIFSAPSADDDAMDVDDSSYAIQLPPTIFTSSDEPPQSAATITTFNHLFYDTTSPRRDRTSPARHQTKKRRSLSPEGTRYLEDDDASSSPVLPSSPAARKLERMVSKEILNNHAKPTLEGLGNPSNGLKRPRRPALSAMVHPTSSSALQSAYPVMSSGDKQDGKGSLRLPPPRRAFSAMLTPAAFEEQYSDESSFCSADMSSPAQAYAKRQQMKTIRRCDGTDDFRPLTGATALISKDSPSSKFMAPGMPGFGDNEAHGKTLPCHRVSEDGLMRITPDTIDKLLDGDFDSKIHEFHIIDCRFEYEYQGGHIAGAVNINTAAAVEEMLLGPSLFKPKPSVSGDAGKKTVLVFHCEFSAKRAPTFAKHLRAKDRAMNNHVYPKIHYPELYILEGGYSRYYKESGLKCEPRGYVTMDDPNHAASRRGDLDQFRKAKFGRHKSYAYGDMTKPSSSSQQQSLKRNSAPTAAPPSMFAAAAGQAARNRRTVSSSLLTLAEDANTTVEGDDTDIDIGDSPCPPPTKAAVLRPGKGMRGPLTRAETYGPGRMPY